MLTKSLGLGTILASFYYLREKCSYAYSFDYREYDLESSIWMIEQSFYNKQRLIPYNKPYDMSKYWYLCRGNNYILAKNNPEILFNNITMLRNESHKSIFDRSLAKRILDDNKYFNEFSKYPDGVKMIIDYYKEHGMVNFADIENINVRLSIIQELYPKKHLIETELRKIDVGLTTYWEIKNPLDDYETYYTFLIKCGKRYIDIIPERYRSYKICMAAIENGNSLYYVPDYNITHEMALIAVEKRNQNIQYVPKRFITPELCSKIVDLDCLKYIPKEYQNINQIMNMITIIPNISFIEYIKLDDEYIFKVACCCGQDPTKITDDAIKSRIIKWYKDNKIYLLKFESVHDVKKFLDGWKGYKVPPSDPAVSLIIPETSTPKTRCIFE